MEDLSIYHDRKNGIYLSAFVGVTHVLNIGIEAPKEFVSQEFTRDQVIKIRDWLSELIEETAPPPSPTNADIIEALTPGSVFTLHNTYNDRHTTWVRAPRGAFNSNNPTVSTTNFEGWIGDHVKVEVNYIHKSEENN